MGGMRKSGTPNPMTAAGKQEHAIVAQTIEDIIGPRLTAEVCIKSYFLSCSCNIFFRLLCVTLTSHCESMVNETCMMLVKCMFCNCENTMEL